MKVGYIGAGSLGMPLALAAELRGHEVSVFDVNPNVAKYISGELPYPFQERDVPTLLSKTKIKVAGSIGELIGDVDLVFAVVQTPHAPEFEGVTPLPEERADFDYQYLQAAVAEVAREAEVQQKVTRLVTVSTCLPGTYRRSIAGLLNSWVRYGYNPCFPAMGDAISDYFNSEFNLLGLDDPETADLLEEFYSTINDAPCVRTDITTAEGAKVLYNLFVTTKITMANACGELCERVGMNFDDIYNTWELATRRLVSTRYLQAGKSDSGQCHPRDLIAMSWLADEVGMSSNLWNELALARENYEDWHATLAIEAMEEYNLPLVLLGRSFKPESNIETGSAAMLMAEILRLQGVQFLHVNDVCNPPPAVFFISTANQRYRDYKFPPGSVVLDPFGLVDDQEGVIVNRIGRR